MLVRNVTKIRNIQTDMNTPELPRISYDSYPKVIIVT